MNEKVAIVILNYNTFADTVACVQSIKKQDYPQNLISIIIVDNASTDDSAAKLRAQFSGSCIHFLQSKENLGFANGNNLGILYARDTLKIDHVLLVNSDIEFYDANTLSEMMKAQEENVAVIGSEILNTNLEPAYLSRLTLPSLKAQRKDCFSRYAYLALQSNPPLYAFYKKLRKNRTTYVPSQYDGVHSRPVETSNDMWIPGCAFMLTPVYFKYYKMLYPYTFMYNEELVISFLCKKIARGGVLLKFFNTVRMLHKDGRSTATLEKVNSGVSVTKLRWMAHASRILLQVMKSSYKKICRKMETYPLAVETHCSFAGVLK